MAWPTAAEIINQAGEEAGVWVSDVADPYASSDPSVLLHCSLLKSLGKKLGRRYHWSHLEIPYTFATVNGQANYALPADFLRIIDGTEWNRTWRLPVASGVSPHQWQRLKAMLSGGVLYKVQRIYQNQVWIHPTPTGADTIAWEYVSSYWVTTAIAAWAALTVYTFGQRRTNDGGQVYECITTGQSAASGGPTGTSQDITDGAAHWKWIASSTASISAGAVAPTAAGDVLQFDHDLLVTGLKLAFRVAKGLDATPEQLDFDRALAAALGGDGDAPSLSLARRPVERLLSESNTPETNYGGS